MKAKIVRILCDCKLAIIFPQPEQLGDWRGDAVFGTKKRYAKVKNSFAKRIPVNIVVYNETNNDILLRGKIFLTGYHDIERKIFFVGTGQPKFKGGRNDYRLQGVPKEKG